MLFRLGRGGPRAHGAILAKVSATLLLIAAPANAEIPAAPPVDRDDVPRSSSSPPTTERRWLYVDDAALPDPMRAVAFSRATYTNATESATRPFASNVGRAGALFEVGGEVGLASMLSVVAVGATGGGPNGASSGANVGLRFRVVGDALGGLVIGAGVLREPSSSGGAWMRITGTQSFGRTRLSATVHAERVLADGRDPVDVMLLAGATYRIAGPAHVGVEYVGQDHEGALDPHEREEGVRHFVGPTVGVDLADRRWTIVGGPAFGLSPRAPRLLGRVGVSYAF